MNKNITYLILGILVCGGVLYFSNKDWGQGKEIEHVQEPGENTQSSNEKNAPEVPTDWKSFQAEDASYSFSYPDLNALLYITATDWPPQIQTLETLPECSETGELIDRAGKTRMKTIESQHYCITEKTEGAAGSNYHQYAYLFQKERKNIALIFTLRFVQCMNYDEPAQAECKKEQGEFGVDELVDHIAETLVFKS